MSITELRAVVPKIVQKIDNDQFEEALKLAEPNGKIAGKLLPIRAYINYRLNQYQKVIDLITNKNTPENVQESIGLLHLLAQTYYKYGLQLVSAQQSANGIKMFQQSASIYSKISTKYQQDSNNNPEFIVNALSAYVNAGDAEGAANLLEQTQLAGKDIEKIATMDKSTYEVLFNMSFYYMTQQQYTLALSTIEKAIVQFKADFAEFDEVFIALDNNDQTVLSQYDLKDLEFDINEYITLQYQRNYIINIAKDNLDVNVADLYNFDAVVGKLNNTLNEIINLATQPEQTTIKALEQYKHKNETKLTKLQNDYITYNLSILYTANNQLEYANKHLNTTSANAKLTLLQPNDVVIVQKEYLLLCFNINNNVKHVKDYAKCDELINAYVSKFFGVADINNLSSSKKLNDENQNTQLKQILVNVILLKLYILIYRSQYQQALNFLNTAVFETKAILQFYNVQNKAELMYKPAMIALYLTLYEQVINKLTKATAVAKNKAKDTSTHDLAMVTKECAQYLEQCLKQKHIVSQPTLVHTLHIKYAYFKAQTNDYVGAISSLEILAKECEKTNKPLYYNYLTKIIQLSIECDDFAKVEKYTAILPEISNAPVAKNDTTAVSNLAQNYITSTTTQILSAQPRNPANKAGGVTTTTLLGKPQYSAQKLAQVKLRKKRKLAKRVLLPKNVTMEQYLAVKTNPQHPERAKINPHRWKPKWERPGFNAKKNKDGTFKGPQGSGISEHTTTETKAKTTTTNTTTDPKKKAGIPPNVAAAAAAKKGGVPPKKGGKK